MNVVFFHQAAADLGLVALWLVTHRRNEFARSEVHLGIAVAVEAPLHTKGGLPAR